MRTLCKYYESGDRFFGSKPWFLENDTSSIVVSGIYVVITSYIPVVTAPVVDASSVACSSVVWAVVGPCVVDNKVLNSPIVVVRIRVIVDVSAVDNLEDISDIVVVISPAVVVSWTTGPKGAHIISTLINLSY